MKCTVIDRLDGARGADGYVVCIAADGRSAWEGPGTRHLARLLGIDLASLARSESFTGKDSQDVYVRIVRGRSSHRLILLGLGKKADVDPALLRRRLQRAGSIMVARGMRRPAVILPEKLPVREDLMLDAVITGLHLGTGRPTSYARSGATKEAPPASIQVVYKAEPDVGRGAVQRAAVLAEVIQEARTWVSEPANMLGPEDLARRAVALGQANGLATEIWKPPRLRKERMGLIEAVGRGSGREPCLVRMDWIPAEKRNGARIPHACIVGKGIVFDSGGLSIKPAKSMVTMKCDMAGAAAATATVAAAARLGLPVRVTALLPIAENTPSSRAYRPGDVIRGRAGKTVEVISTDAEGRLVMADAIALAAEEKPDVIIDIATLTGACMVALGSYTAGLWASDDDLAARIADAARRTGESMWRMPLLAELRPFLKSDIADLRNSSSDPYGGAISAALFLKEFTAGIPWAHLDVAGPAWHDKRTDLGPRGATGFGITTLVGYLAAMNVT